MVDACGAAGAASLQSLGLAVGQTGEGGGGIIPPGWQENAHLCLAAGGKALYEP